MGESTISILPFAQAEQVFSGEQLASVAMSPGESPRMVLNRLCPTWRELLPTTRIAVNMEFVDPETYSLQAGDTLALIPPVSGG